MRERTQKKDQTKSGGLLKFMSEFLEGMSASEFD